MCQAISTSHVVNYDYIKYKKKESSSEINKLLINIQKEENSNITDENLRNNYKNCQQVTNMEVKKERSSEDISTILYNLFYDINTPTIEKVDSLPCSLSQYVKTNSIPIEIIYDYQKKVHDLFVFVKNFRLDFSWFFSDVTSKPQYWYNYKIGSVSLTKLKQIKKVLKQVMQFLKKKSTEINDVISLIHSEWNLPFNIIKEFFQIRDELLDFLPFQTFSLNELHLHHVSKECNDFLNKFMKKIKELEEIK